MFSEALSYVAIVAREPEQTARRLSDLFELPRADLRAADGSVAALAVGRSALVVLPPGHALAGGRAQPGVDHIGIGAADPEAAARAASARGFAHGAPTAGLDGAGIVPLAPEQLQGVRAVLAPPLRLPAAASARVSRIDHLGIAVRSIDDALRFYRDQLGLSLASRETVVTEEVHAAMLPAGGPKIELLEPTSSDSVVGRFLEKRGEGLHHVALNVPDLDAAVARLRESGVRLLNEPRRGAGGHVYVFVHPASASGVLLELIQDEEIHH